MKRSFRIRRNRSASRAEHTFFKKEGEPAFFETRNANPFFAAPGTTIQRKSGTTQSIVPYSSYLSTLNGKGQNMSPSVRSFFEGRMGADFSDVRIHTGPEAAASAQSVDAQAYAYANHIVFNEGKYSPETRAGKHLLAHELTHITQAPANNGSIISRTTTTRRTGYHASESNYQPSPIPRQQVIDNLVRQLTPSELLQICAALRDRTQGAVPGAPPQPAQR